MIRSRFRLGPLLALCSVQPEDAEYADIAKQCPSLEQRRGRDLTDRQRKKGGRCEIERAKIDVKHRWTVGEKSWEARGQKGRRTETHTHWQKEAIGEEKVEIYHCHAGLEPWTIIFQIINKNVNLIKNINLFNYFNCFRKCVKLANVRQ